VPGVSDSTTELLELWRREAARPFAGWDFSYLEGRWQGRGPSWSYDELVCGHAVGASSLLDLGTGGGERLLGLRPALPPFTAAIEGYWPNVMIAARALRPSGIAVVAARVATDAALPFAAGAFEVITNRHSAFAWSEVERVLAPGGWFVTQQVGGRDLHDLMAVFSTSSRWPGAGLQKSLDWLHRTTRLVVERVDEEQGELEFQDVGALVYFLRAIPWIVPGFSADTHFEVLLALQRRLEANGPLVFSTHRYLVVARRPPV
jgi:SAM-dependent methyltransferase